MSSDDMPDEFAFTIRVNGATDPALAHALWTVPWGSRNRMALELMALGLASKQAGGAIAHPLLTHPIPRRQQQSKAKPTRAKRAAKVAVVETATAAAPAPPQSPHALAPLQSPSAVGPLSSQLPAVQYTPTSTDPPAASTPTMDPAPTAPQTPPPDASNAESRPASPGLSLLLGQFDDD